MAKKGKLSSLCLSRLKWKFLAGAGWSLLGCWLHQTAHNFKLRAPDHRNWMARSGPTTSGHFSALEKQGKSRRELIKPGMDFGPHNPLVSSLFLPFYFGHCVCESFGFSSLGFRFPLALLSIINSEEQWGRVILLNDFYCIQFSFPACLRLRWPKKQKPKQSKQKLISFCYFWHWAGLAGAGDGSAKTTYIPYYLLSGVRGGSWGEITSSLAFDGNKEHFWLFNNDENQSILWQSIYLNAWRRNTYLSAAM